ncbi:unnamed protein product [Tilletia laevis]|uniref:Cytochrome c domain-containing protein n=1 Tax=Tilletia laevis TaxID=157183 RepID=A0A9N8LF36_9BASI|nr:unnamed protein product [Tilletia caries]CAD6896707.1 unnamed protein product [Tilletia laevis]CAD6918880.1 unnamed protein product [Tilletia caries]CAD6920319.1 unnamed protein product [Tilletia controversa]CAD6933235.1 unnamed protein product [Tilletia controversa]
MRGSSTAAAAAANSLCSAVHHSARSSLSALPPARLLCGQSTRSPRPRAGLASSSSSRSSHTSSIRPSAPVYQPSSPSEHQSSSTPANNNLTLKFRASSNGEWYTITDAQIGESLKDVAKRHELPSIEATCGGQCECATCHAYIVTGGGENSAPELDTEPPETVFPEKSEAEDDMLDYAIDRRPSSRLTCQVKVTREMAEWMQQTGGWIELPRF